MTAVKLTTIYITDLKTTLTGLVNAGHFTVIDNADATISDVIAALDNLKTGETAFTNGMAPYNDFTAYHKYCTGHLWCRNAHSRFITCKSHINADSCKSMPVQKHCCSPIITSAKTALETAYPNTTTTSFQHMQHSEHRFRRWRLQRLSVVDPQSERTISDVLHSQCKLTDAKTAALKLYWQTEQQKPHSSIPQKLNLKLHWVPILMLSHALLLQSIHITKFIHTEWITGDRWYCEKHSLCWWHRQS